MLHNEPRFTLRRASAILVTLIGFHFSVGWLAGADRWVSQSEEKGGFGLVSGRGAAPIFLSEEDYAGVHRVAKHLQADVSAVTGKQPLLSIGEVPSGKEVVLVGTLGRNPIVDELAAAGKIEVSSVAGRWDTFGVQTVKEPLPGVDQALVIFGSDKRGTIYGMYELSKQMGVSPWYWWADVPVQKKDEVYVAAGFHTLGEPKVKYRGIFINDEAPALRNWAKEKFGGHNSEFYDRVFELILRNKGNYLWPAMWLPTMFYVDDPENARLADEYGIVMATSHHEPLSRAHEEWAAFGEGDWNYETNKEQLQEFWREGVARTKGLETAITVGMRGDGDEAMSEETAVDLLKEIVTDQREILEDVLEKPAEEIQQVWALYKEVQDYYLEGMRVEEDILILFSDDNWGNVRILPRPEDRDYPGGYGMYYHFDYVGGPVSYRWLNTTQIERVWEQMTLTYQWGVDDLWIVNVGDIKPMELPISFFMDLAWNPDAIQAQDLPSYYVEWARAQFGEAHAEEIGDLLALYTKYNARRTPEMLKGNTYSVGNYREADRIVEEYRELAVRARTVNDRLPEAARSAFYQLVLYPIEACSNLNEMYVAAGKNDYYAVRGVPYANHFADEVRERFARDAEFAEHYHNLNDGKWNHMMSQTRMGYTSWFHPPMDRTPPVTYLSVGGRGELGYFLENGKEPRWGWLDVESDWKFSESMPEFNVNNDQSYYLEVVNRGRGELSYEISAREDWIRISKAKGTIQYAEKVYVSIDWSKAPQGRSEGTLEISGSGRSYAIAVPIKNERRELKGFVEKDGVVSIEAAHFHKSESLDSVRWITVPNLGRTGSSITPSPANAERIPLGLSAPRLEYTFTLLEDAEVDLHTYVSPTQDFKAADGLHFAFAIDGEDPRLVNINKGEVEPDWKYADWWNQSVGDHIKVSVSELGEMSAGTHTLKVWMVDPGVVLQKFVLDAGGMRPSYLGPPESQQAP